MTYPHSYRMDGRVCLVTGATSGHGAAVARALTGLGAEVVIHGRSPVRCEALAAQIAREAGTRPRTLLCDLSALDQVRRGAAELLDGGAPLHVLVNNAGLVNLRRRETADGFEQTIGVNYLAHFLLTRLLLPRLSRSAGAMPSRIVNVSSDMHRLVRLRLDDLHWRQGRYDLLSSYARSKLAQVYFTRELARRVDPGRVTVNALDPGPVESRIGQNHGGLAPRALSVVMRACFPSAQRAARMAVQLAADPELERVTGRYFRFGRERRPSVSPDPTLGARLWELSSLLVGLEG